MAKREELPADFVPFTGFPTRENCNPNDPYQAYLWALVALPYQKGAQLIVPVVYLQFISKRIWDCYGPPNPDWEPLSKYRPPLNGDPNWLTNPGSWVPADTPDADQRRPVEKALDNLLPAQQAEIADELWSRMSPEQRRMMMARQEELDRVLGN